jgi:hypothetical protein
MSEETPNYLELAKLSQESIKNRQSFEWRINFSLWAALGLIVFALIRHRIPPCSLCNYLTGAGLLLVAVGYVWSIGLIAWAHSIDKRWKQYYLGRADGTDPNLEKPSRKSAPSWEWPVSQVLFTGGLILLAIGVLHGIGKSGNSCFPNDCYNSSSSHRGFRHPMMMGEGMMMDGKQAICCHKDSNAIVDTVGYGGYKCPKRR